MVPARNKRVRSIDYCDSETHLAAQKRRQDGKGDKKRAQKGIQRSKY
jgi:hypothetical protein